MISSMINLSGPASNEAERSASWTHGTQCRMMHSKSRIFGRISALRFVPTTMIRYWSKVGDMPSQGVKDT